MTVLAGVLLVVVAAVAVVDWFAVARSNQPLEHLAKPAVLVALIGVALALDPASEAQRLWFVAALALALAGDVYLMLPDDRFFAAGLGAFLLAHLAYVAGFVTGGLEPTALGAGAAVAVGAILLVGWRILLGARPAGLRVAVGLYMVAIAAMVAVAFGSGRPAAAVGALLFFASDALIGWRRFVGDRPWMPVTVIVTYHLGQAGLVLSLAG